MIAIGKPALSARARSGELAGRQIEGLCELIGARQRMPQLEAPVARVVGRFGSAIGQARGGHGVRAWVRRGLGALALGAGTVQLGERDLVDLDRVFSRSSFSSPASRSRIFA